MPFSYKPDDAARLQYPWNITLLSQRDVELTIPIPYVTAPGVSLTAACFPDGRYEDYAATKCLSNLLALGYRRLHVDLYWDAERHVWSLCPVQVPDPSSVNLARPDDGVTRSPNSPPSTRSTDTAQSTAPTGLSSSTAITTGIAARQPGINPMNPTVTGPTSHKSSLISKATVTVQVSTVSDSTFPVLPTHTPSHADEILYSIGPYVCSTTPALHLLNQVLLSFLDTTDNTLEAVLKYLILNIHAAASVIAPDSPAHEPAEPDLPSPANSLGSLFYSTYSDYLYTPVTLRTQRRDINASWYLASEDYEPDHAYFSLKIEDGVATTPNGWPSESVMEFQSDNHQRLLVGFGTIDPQMQHYDHSKDDRVIFAPGDLMDKTTNCFFDSEKFSLSAVNNSWAVTGLTDLVPSDFSDGNYDSPVTALADLTACGVSTLLNQTLANVAANERVRPYKDFAFSSVWSWAWSEPHMGSDDNPLRCAVLSPSSRGRWHAKDCSSKYRAACRLSNHPYRWTISKSSGEYTDAKTFCPEHSKFDVPRTALENRYLLHEYMSSSSHKDPIWIDFNSVEVEFCWVSGRNATCPYITGTDDSAQIYVPTVAGFIIVIVAGLLVLVKCGANRRNSRRRRRAADGWDYEGVPS